MGRLNRVLRPVSCCWRIRGNISNHAAECIIGIEIERSTLGASGASNTVPSEPIPRRHSTASYCVIVNKIELTDQTRSLEQLNCKVTFTLITGPSEKALTSNPLLEAQTPPIGAHLHFSHQTFLRRIFLLIFLHFYLHLFSDFIPLALPKFLQ